MIKQVLLVFIFFLLAFSGNSESVVEPVAIIVHKTNPIEKLKKNELAQIYQGRKDRWPDGQKIVPINHPVETKIRGSFYSYLFKSKPSKRFYNRATPVPFMTMVVISDASVLRYIAHIENAIGYVSLSNVDDSVKILQIEER